MRSTDTVLRILQFGRYSTSCWFTLWCFSACTFLRRSADNEGFVFRRRRSDFVLYSGQYKSITWVLWSALWDTRDVPQIIPLFTMNQTREYRGTLRGTHDEYGRPTNSSTIHADRQGVALLHIHSIISVGDKGVWKIVLPTSSFCCA